MSNKFLKQYPQLLEINPGDIVSLRTRYQKAVFQVIHSGYRDMLLVKCIYTPYSNFGKLYRSYSFVKSQLMRNIDFDIRQLNEPDTGTKVMLHRSKGPIGIDMIGVVDYRQYSHYGKKYYYVNFLHMDTTVQVKCLRKELIIVYDQ